MRRRWAPRRAATRVAGVLALLCVAAGAALPAQSMADVLCVNKTGTQCNQLFAAGNIADAFTAANSNQASFDRIEIGPGVYPNGPFNAASNIEIAGAGMTETVLTHAAPLPLNSIMLLANFGEPVVRDLTIRVGASESSRGLQIGGGRVERVRVEATEESEVSPAVDAFGVTARNIEVFTPANALAVSGGGTIEDSVITGGSALSWNSGVARRLRLTASAGAAARMSGTSRLENSLLKVTGPNAIGIDSGEFNPGAVSISHVTVTGDGSPGSVGVQAAKSVGGTFGPGTASIEIRNSTFTGFAVGLRHRGAAGLVTSPCFPNCQLAQQTSVSWSQIGAPIDNQGGPGSLAIGEGMINEPAPGFVDAAAGDFRPRFDSPLVDAGQPGALGEGPFYLNESPLTVAGGPRILAGRAQATTPRRDIGALEYGRQAPTAALGGVPARAFLYRPVSFSAAGSDPDGDPLTFTFDFGEPGSSSGPSPAPRVRHAFVGLGAKRVRLTVTDPTGLAAVAAADLRVVARPGSCANRRVGGPRRDRFNGSPAGDRLIGRGGKDVLRGKGSSDCLNGGPGADRLAGGAGPDRVNGGAGRDTLNGGAGADRLFGGPGADRVNGGPGNDFINVRGGGRDTVNCGPGRRDRVIADRRDRIRNCERVRRS